MKERNINIEDIKSLFILKKIFSLICNNKKLSLINYNKQLQNKLLINLENYKIASYKYKVVEKDGIGKEFNEEYKYINI